MEPTARSALVAVALSTNHRKGGTWGQTCLHRRSTKRKSTSHGPTQQDSNKNISSILTQIKKKKIVETITYIKTTACVEAMHRCIWMSRLKHVVRETTVTVRDREVRRDGRIFARGVGV